MASEGQSIEYELVETGLAVGFRIVSEEVLSAPDEAEFGMRLELKFVAEDDAEQDEDDVAEDTAEWDLSASCFSSEHFHLPMRNRATSRLLTIAKRINLGLQTW